MARHREEISQFVSTADHVRAGPFHAIAVILDDRLFFAGDGLDLPGGGNLDPGLDHVGDRRQERVRRHGRLLLCGEQHL